MPANTRKPTHRAREKSPKKIGAPKIPRAADGKFLKGASGNPSGRPVIAHEVRECAAAHSIEALLKTVHIMRTSKDHSTVLAAARTIIDRAVGKPMQPIAGAHGASLVTINTGVITSTADAARIYQELCRDPSLDASALQFAPAQEVEK